MRLFEAILVFVCSLVLWWEVRTGLTEYAAFMLLSETLHRQQHYRRWELRGLLLFTGSALACLIVLGRWQALASLPREFAGISMALRDVAPDIHFSKSILLSRLAAVGAGAVLGGVVAAKLADKGCSLMIGNVKPLMPRNWTETGCAILLALNGGLGEELFPAVPPAIARSGISKHDLWLYCCRSRVRPHSCVSGSRGRYWS